MQYDIVTTNRRWRPAAILKMFFSLYLGRESTNSDGIWYAGTNFDSEDDYMTKKLKILQI